MEPRQPKSRNSSSSNSCSILAPGSRESYESGDSGHGSCSTASLLLQSGGGGSELPADSLPAPLPANSSAGRSALIGCATDWPARYSPQPQPQPSPSLTATCDAIPMRLTEMPPTRQHHYQNFAAPPPNHASHLSGQSQSQHTQPHAQQAHTHAQLWTHPAHTTHVIGRRANDNSGMTCDTRLTFAPHQLRHPHSETTPPTTNNSATMYAWPLQRRQDYRIAQTAHTVQQHAGNTEQQCTLTGSSCGGLEASAEARVCAFFNRIQLAQYAARFCEAAIDMDVLTLITHDDLLQLGITNARHRSHILMEIAQLSQCDVTTGASGASGAGLQAVRRHCEQVNPLRTTLGQLLLQHVGLSGPACSQVRAALRVESVVSLVTELSRREEIVRLALPLGAQKRLEVCVFSLSRNSQLRTIAPHHTVPHPLPGVARVVGAGVPPSSSKSTDSLLSVLRNCAASNQHHPQQLEHQQTSKGKESAPAPPRRISSQLSCEVTSPPCPPRNGSRIMNGDGGVGVNGSDTQHTNWDWPAPPERSASHCHRAASDVSDCGVQVRDSCCYENMWVGGGALSSQNSQINQSRIAQSALATPARRQASFVLNRTVENFLQSHSATQSAIPVATPPPLITPHRHQSAVNLELACLVSPSSSFICLQQQQQQRLPLTSCSAFSFSTSGTSSTSSMVVVSQQKPRSNSLGRHQHATHLDEEPNSAPLGVAPPTYQNQKRLQHPPLMCGGAARLDSVVAPPSSANRTLSKISPLPENPENENEEDKEDELAPAKEASKEASKETNKETNKEASSKSSITASAHANTNANKLGDSPKSIAVSLPYSLSGVKKSSLLTNRELAASGKHSSEKDHESKKRIVISSHIKEKVRLPNLYVSNSSSSSGSKPGTDSGDFSEICNLINDVNVLCRSDVLRTGKNHAPS